MEHVLQQLLSVTACPLRLSALLWTRPQHGGQVPHGRHSPWNVNSSNPRGDDCRLINRFTNLFWTAGILSLFISCKPVVLWINLKYNCISWEKKNTLLMKTLRISARPNEKIILTLNCHRQLSNTSGSQNGTFYIPCKILKSKYFVFSWNKCLGGNFKIYFWLVSLLVGNWV